MNANLHRRTPALSVIDGRGLPVRQVAYLRSLADAPATTLTSRQQHDAAGRLIAQWDPRLTAPNATTLYTLAGAPLKIDSVDAGWRLNLPGLAGQALQHWDARGSHWRTTYDDYLRIIAIAENAVADYEVFTYATAAADAGHNLRGQLITLSDATGRVDFHDYGLLGAALKETRTFLDTQAYTSQRTHSPLGALLEQTDAGGHRQQSSFDVAGQLTHLALRLNGQPTWQAILQAALYNAGGQIIEQHAGNGVISRWSYDAANSLLHRQTSQKPGEPLLQDFEYAYDPVGNTTRILDHAFSPSHFANQRIDGHREFSYDSLYRLVQASGYDDALPSDIPGLPQPNDPADRRNYARTYAYDAGGNLIETVHVRDGASQTLRMFIDPSSNKGVRWKTGDPQPDFAQLFDRNGNLRALQPGQDVQWSATDDVETVTLVKRDGAVDDAEHYYYSQGARVHKRLETASGHFHDVRYLPGLEIRRKDNGEELHVISLAAGSGNVRCLHWLTGKPTGIDADQLRYSLEDHLGSSLMELDQQARMISHEGFYPFGATAWMAARSTIEAGYKTVRYSGKEMDVSGLYYYGARYYAPWLQRWISADPGGDVDGLNLYGFVGNNPIRYIDPSGGSRAEGVILLYSAFISALNEHAERTLVQIHNVIHQENITQNLMMNLAGETALGFLGYEGGALGAQQVGQVLPSAPHMLQFSDSNALIGGNFGGDLAGAMAAPVSGSSGMMGSLIPQTSTMSIAAIDSQLGLPTGTGKAIASWSDLKDEVIHPALNSVLNPEFVMNRVMSSWLAIIPGALNMFQRAIEAEDIKNRLDPVKIEKIDMMLAEWKSAVEDRWANAEKAFAALGAEVVNPADFMPNVNGMTPKEAIAPVNRSALAEQTRRTLDLIGRMQQGMSVYKEMGTTDNQHALKKGETKTNRFPRISAAAAWWGKSVESPRPRRP
jgi:insecticidal toxin complex protein TccC